MRAFIFFLFSALFVTSSLFAQLAIVVDDGGFVNVYDSEKEELDRLGVDGVVSVKEMDGEWALVDYTKYGDYAASSGYIKKANLVDLASFEEIKLDLDSVSYIILGNDVLSIEIEAKPFDALTNAISYLSESPYQVSSINGEVYWGTKLGLPARQYQSIVCSIQGETISFPDEALFNLFNPHPSLTKAYYDRDRDLIYLVAVNGDATGAYTVVWLIESGEYSVHYIFD